MSSSELNSKRLNAHIVILLIKYNIYRVVLIKNTVQYKRNLKTMNYLELLLFISLVVINVSFFLNHCYQFIGGGNGLFTTSYRGRSNLTNCESSNFPLLPPPGNFYDS